METKQVLLFTVLFLAVIQGLRANQAGKLAYYIAKNDTDRFCTELVRTSVSDLNQLAITETGMDLGAASGVGTPLMWAAQYGREWAVKNLINKGATLTIKDRYGRTAQEILDSQFYGTAAQKAAIEEQFKEAHKSGRVSTGTSCPTL